MLNNNHQLAEVEALERRLLEPAVRSSRKALNELLADEFVEFGSSGRVWNRSEIIADLLAESKSEIEMDCVQARHIGENVILLTYRSRRVAEPESAAALRSSLWRRQEGSWKLTFHQGTKARPD